MILTKKKDLDEIIGNLGSAKKILVLGCGTCVTVHKTGGSKEARKLASAIKLAFKGKRKVDAYSDVVLRQCEPDMVAELSEEIDEYDAIVSLACGAGAQLVAEVYQTKRLVPGLDTQYIGVVKPEGEREYCRGCGRCIIGETVGICPITGCAKSMLNGPCGGVNDGMCEVEGRGKCVWVMIFNKMKEMGMLDDFMKVRTRRGR
ncbi:MAG: methylenetetrahydrofolate reductase C-terminal domain-containing protein [Candidatus Altiarchaeota archaeon]